jgi:STE24 endopeptidase
MRALRILFLLFAFTAFGASPPAPIVPLAAQPSAHFDVYAATNGWLDTAPSTARARSNAYFEGGYWLILWDFLYGAAVMVLLLETRISARMRDLAERAVRFHWVQSFLYWLQFAVATAALTFPLTVYEDFFREHKYGLSNQDFASWLRDQLAGMLVVMSLGGIALVILAGIVRRRLKAGNFGGPEFRLSSCSSAC